MQRSIALIGLSGAGKSSVACLLAARLGWPWADTDAAIVAATGRPVAELFAQEGEAAFRERETATLGALLHEAARLVLATGGGIVLREENRALLRSRAWVVWLDAPDDVLIARLTASDEERPLLSGDAVARLAGLRAAREPLYEALADLRLDTAALSLAEVVGRIFEQMCYNKDA